MNRVVDGELELVSDWGPLSRSPRGTRYPLDRGYGSSRAVLDATVVSAYGEPEEIAAELPITAELSRAHGIRANLSVPLLREGVAVGVITIRRVEAIPFSAKQIELLQTFADQAVIAIENARLFDTLEQRNAQLASALDQQTALADVLRIIASTPTDLDRVLQAIVETAARLCDAPTVVIHLAKDDHLVRRASFGRIFACWAPADRPLSRGYITGRARARSPDVSCR